MDRVTCWLFNNSCIKVTIGQFTVLVYPLQVKIKFSFQFLTQVDSLLPLSPGHNCS